MISQFFINRPRFAIVIAILFLLSGLIALFTLPITLYPNITPSVITVSTRYPGAEAQTGARHRDSADRIADQRRQADALHVVNRDGRRFGFGQGDV